MPPPFPAHRRTVFPELSRHTDGHLTDLQPATDFQRFVEGRNLIGQDTPAQEPIICFPEHRGRRLHYAAVVDDKLIVPIRFIGQIAVDSVNGIMFASGGRLIDIE